MKHALTVLVLPLVLSSCERDHSDPLVTPPDAPGDEAPETGPGPGPGAGDPLDPDQRIECEPEDGYRSGFNGSGVEYSRTRGVHAVWAGTGVPSGTPWVCKNNPPTPGQDCDLPACAVVGDLRETRCYQSTWQLAGDQTYFVLCGHQVETDADGDGIFEGGGSPEPSHVAIIEP